MRAINPHSTCIHATRILYRKYTAHVSAMYQRTCMHEYMQYKSEGSSLLQLDGSSHCPEADWNQCERGTSYCHKVVTSKYVVRIVILAHSRSLMKCNHWFEPPHMLHFPSLYQDACLCLYLDASICTHAFFACSHNFGWQKLLALSRLRYVVEIRACVVILRAYVCVLFCTHPVSFAPDIHVHEDAGMS